MTLNDKTRKHNDMDFQKDLSVNLDQCENWTLGESEMDEGQRAENVFR